MKKVINQLMKLCPGRLSIQIDYHKLFNESASKFISDNEFEFINVPKNVIGEMISSNTVIMVQANPTSKPMEAKAYHYDLELALKDCLAQIQLWQPKK